ncbi:hypothetical protein ACH5Y9_05745 [Methylomonas sp. BW4-1]|uniref:Uncharacterized protein n=1 Tax=Methylomonas defluvii TaxID=3045149 RepID=A0ABU4UI29_9GAMM|nr:MULTISPECIES: hypothetical protein [unclassified Methylomonas]MDX8129128.1 hypothetical protein [Methylomonas sp. OY6]NOV30021.1 hypothetical protein [Methylomonas sp. ZR1]PKD41457.1 hypothetical protein CWO84_04825 [Methylomonas sp. Kb3]QBC27157.1 hypothetical protein U737_09730 [Methylomonas sp. LW13]QSA99761.1 hypothetical protein JWZ98_13810 [Methylomonas sp. EFPC1]
MAEFFIEISAQENGDHLIHKSSCSLLPAKEAIYYLGSISNVVSAAKKASERFAKPTACSQCSPV